MSNRISISQQLGLYFELVLALKWGYRYTYEYSMML